LFKSREGHLPRLGILLRNNHFQRRVIRIIVDEAHNVHIAGLPRYGIDAFRPAWGKLDELKAILLQMTRWTACSATFTRLALRTVETKIMRSNYVSIHLTSNRPNTVYATHQVVK
jgi:superfamily II DNA helicase RecQ